VPGDNDGVPLAARSRTDEPAGPASAEVAVVGAGPAGLVAGITLAGYGIDVLVVEKRRTISSLSRALVISTRSMEILRAWGLEDRVRAGAADVEPSCWVTPSLASGEGYEMPLGYPSAADAAAISPTRPAWAPQDHLEPLLLAELQAAPSARVWMGNELIDVVQKGDVVDTLVRDAVSGRTRGVTARFVLAGDGAHSKVRERLGIGMEGPDDLAEFHRVEFSAPLAEVVRARRYGLYVITAPGAAGVLAPRGVGDRWGFSREWMPGQSRLVDMPPDDLIALLRAATGIATLSVHIERLATFRFAAQIADRYRQGRAFLLGDAAHRMTPRGGTGMNTAIQDAFDIGWKLAWVLSGWADPRLLDTYEEERRPIGLHNVQRAGGPDGARREATEALPYDLAGRLDHHWVSRGGGQVSTLDLLGDGLTLLTGPDESRWATASLTLPFRAPLTVEPLERTTARALGVPPGGCLLLRPDGKRVGLWPAFTEHLEGEGSG